MVNLKKAQEMLEKAYAEASLIKPEEELNIDPRLLEILEGKHLTFRYIVITNLLAKATDPKIHSRALQAGSKLKGAFDSRSICHKVLVPFERDKLNNILGGSNEPYLNKPARYVEVSKKNSVRHGNDKKLLGLLYEILEEVNLKKNLAFKYLVKALAVLQRINLKKDAQIKAISPLANKDVLLRIKKFLDNSCEGQSAALVADILFELLFQKINPQALVSSHPVNQSGKSSHEVLDIDITLENKVFCSFEVKDKKVLITDMKHMFKKAMDKNVLNFGIVLGPQGELEIPLFDLPAIQLSSLLGIVSVLYDNEFGQTFIDSLKRRMISKRISDECREKLHESFR